MHIGIDFDNTLADYDHLFAAGARSRGWLPNASEFPGKPALRRMVRAMPDGENRWQDLQVEVYAHRMAEARLAPGADHFIRTCRARSVPLCIISHKTRHAARDPLQTDLRQAAWNWMTEQGFFAADGLGFTSGDVVFATTRAEKLAHMAARSCTHFIDDLVEVLAEPEFPRFTQGILYCPTAPLPEHANWPIYRNWHDLAHDLFPA
ncbi:MAG: hypothetical protein H7833_03485 [Magnetococcus sp. DMHC-1]